MTTVLIVDDSTIARHTTRNILEDAGYRVVEATNGIAALALYSKEKPTFVLIDIVTEGMNGLELLKRLREFDSRVIAIFVTADIQTSMKEIALQEGAAGFLVKPVAAGDLVTAMNTALSRSPKS